MCKYQARPAMTESIIEPDGIHYSAKLKSNLKHKTKSNLWKSTIMFCGVNLILNPTEACHENASRHKRPPMGRGIG